MALPTILPLESSENVHLGSTSRQRVSYSAGRVCWAVSGWDRGEGEEREMSGEQPKLDLENMPAPAKASW